jgi:cytochrome b involved in lipid metabolism
MAAMPATLTAAEEATPAVFDREVVEHQDPATAVFFGCAYCSQAFPEESELEVHIRMSHEGSAYSVVPAQLPRTCSEILHSGGHKLFSEGIPMSEVERHCTPEDCWVVINGKVYDLTEFLGRHPGGPKSILAWAGKDGSEVFNHIHQEAWIQQYLLPESLLGELGLAEGVSDAYWHSLKEAHVLEIQQELIGLQQAANLPRLLASRSGDGGKEASKENLEGHNGVDDGLAARLHELEDRMHAAAKSEDYGAAAQLKQEIVRLRQGGDEAVPHTHDGTATIVSGIPLSEVRKHNTAEDCWVALNGWVYDEGCGARNGAVRHRAQSRL